MVKMAGEARQKWKQLCLNEEIQVENMLRRKEPQAGTVPHRKSGYKKRKFRVERVDTRHFGSP